jgi:hypothetical protein
MNGIVHISIRIDCNRISEGLLYYPRICPEGLSKPKENRRCTRRDTNPAPA